MNELMLGGLVWAVNFPTNCGNRQTFNRLYELVAFIVKESEKHFTKPQIELIILAMKLSAEWHGGFYRKDHDGKTTPYIIHPLEVVETLLMLGIYDFKLIIAAILHDVVEDESDKNKRYRKRNLITKTFGSTVRDVVELVTKAREEWKKKLFFPRLLGEKRIHIAWRGKVLKLVDSETNGRTYEVFAPNPKKLEEKIAENDREYPPVAESLARDINKLVRAGKLKAHPYKNLPVVLLDRLMKTIEPFR